MATITTIQGKDIILSITGDSYTNSNKEYIEETIGHFLTTGVTSGTFEYCLESDIERKKPLPIKWEAIRTKEQLLEDLDNMIEELNLRVNNTEDFKKSSNISRIVDRVELVKKEIEERF